MDAKGLLMHIDRTDEIAVAAKPAATADPSSSFGFVLMLASGTPAASASFGAGRAQDASLFAFVHEVIKVFAVFPLRHATIVVTATIAGAHAVRIADEERADVVRDAEVDDFASGLMPQVTDATLGPTAYLVLGPLEFFPASRVFGAAALLFGELPELLAALPLERADAAPGDDERLARAGRHGGQVNLTEVHGCLHRAGSLFRLRDLNPSLVSSKPRFHTSVHAPALSGRESGRTRDGWPLPIGNTTRPFSRWTAWAGHLTG